MHKHRPTFLIEKYFIILHFKINNFNKAWHQQVIIEDSSSTEADIIVKKSSSNMKIKNESDGVDSSDSGNGGDSSNSFDGSGRRGRDGGCRRSGNGRG